MIDQMQWIFFSIPALLIASSVHEYSHAFIAYKLGDYTAKMNGRMTLNPLAHIDPIGALMMVFARIGWSKPVPVNEYHFKNPVTGTALTSFAGPASNLIVAIVASVVLRLLPVSILFTGNTSNPTFIAALMITFITVNISLAIFNLLPVPPLDGHKIVRALLPKGLRYHWENLERYGMWLLILLFLPFSPLSTLTFAALRQVMSFLLNVLVG